jgi:DNA-binding transcriptional regulator LsrR (DeoR family)
MRNALTRLAPCTVVQLTGALTRPDVDESSVELVRAVARVARGSAYCFYAPMFVGDAATATTLLRQPEIARATKLFDRVTKAVVGVGGWDPPHSTVYDALSGPERQELSDLGTRADLSGVLLDANGTAVGGSFTDRVIGIKAAQLRHIPDVIAIAYGAAKAPAARAAIAGGYVNSLVTHAGFAKALLQKTEPRIGEEG